MWDYENEIRMDNHNKILIITHQKMLRTMTAEGFEKNKANKDRRLNKINLVDVEEMRKPLEIYPHYIEIMSWWLKGEKEKFVSMMENIDKNSSYNAKE